MTQSRAITLWSLWGNEFKTRPSEFRHHDRKVRELWLAEDWEDALCEEYAREGKKALDEQFAKALQAVLIPCGGFCAKGR